MIGDVVLYLLSRDFNIGVIVGITLSIAVCWHHDRQKARKERKNVRR